VGGGEDLICVFVPLKPVSLELKLTHYISLNFFASLQVQEDTTRKLRRAAEPYSITAAAANARTPASVFLVEPPLHMKPRPDEESGNVWLKGEDIADVLMLAGNTVSEETVEAAIQQLRNFLPGIISGKFCLQELLAINEFAMDLRGSAPATPVRTAKRTPKAKAEVVVPNPLSSSQEFKANEERMHQVSQGTWRLPFRGKTKPISKAAIREEFRRLDCIQGEGRLTMLNLRSALELREVRETEQTVREWFKAHDRGEKGYISLQDYEAIYDSEGLGRSQLRATFADLTHTAASASPSGRPASPSALKKRAAEERLSLLRKAFDRYDADRDGKISSEDLRKAFTAQGKAFTPSDLRTWVQTRDLSGLGAVSFDDFVKHYK
jgi:Ca2+-binding EF-hand superfamily protein